METCADILSIKVRFGVGDSSSDSDKVGDRNLLMKARGCG